MLIDKTKCIGCGKCIPYCPVEAIYLNENAHISQEKCVECGACIRSGVCPVDAFEEVELDWPRALRKIFSDPLGSHPTTSHMGRGTEEVKTNDVTKLVTPGNVGVAIDYGRPGVGSSFKDLEKITIELAKIGVDFHEQTPITSLFSDKEKGILKKEILEERFLSAIIEFIIEEKKVPDVLKSLKKVENKINSVFSLALFYAGGNEKKFPSKEFFKNLNYEIFDTAKINIGLGRRDN